MATEIITGQPMATAADITIRIIRATPSKFTIRPAIPMGIAGLTIAAGIDTYIAAAIADIIITTGKTSASRKGDDLPIRFVVENFGCSIARASPPSRYEGKRKPTTRALWPSARG